MTLKTWQHTLVFVTHGLAIAHSVHFLAPAHTELGGKRGGGWNHRTVLLSLAVVVNVVAAVGVCAIPKRNAFVASVICGLQTVALSSDTIWKCTFVLAGNKLVWFMQVVVFLAAARKLAARLATGGASGASFFTQPQTLFLSGIIFNTVALLAAPNSSIRQ